MRLNRALDARRGEGEAERGHREVEPDGLQVREARQRRVQWRGAANGAQGVELQMRDEFDVVVGGTVRSVALRDELISLGVADVFPGSTPLPEVVRRVVALVAARHDREIQRS